MIGTRAEWLAARRELLEQEKALTRRGDELARQRQQLPWVPVEKDYELLDRAPKGRGSREELGDWPLRHDEYEEAIHVG